MRFTRPVTLRRYEAGSRGSDGRWSNGAPTDSTIQANIQPVKDGKSLEVLEEGMRTRDVIRYSTVAEVRTAEQNAGTPPDELVVDGVVYEVQTAQPWRNILPHYEGLAVRKAEEPA